MASVCDGVPGIRAYGKTAKAVLLLACIPTQARMAGGNVVDLGRPHRKKV